MKHFVITKVLHESFEDDFHLGQGRAVSGGTYPLELSAHTPEQLLEKILSHFSITEADLSTLEDGDDLGAITFTRLEDATSSPATPDDLKRWKAGQQKLYITHYFTRSYECTPVNIIKSKEA